MCFYTEIFAFNIYKSGWWQMQELERVHSYDPINGPPSDVQV